jgi:hypothetical protein
MSLKHILTSSTGETVKYDERPPVRHARVTNIKIDEENAYILGQRIKDFQIPKEVIVKWRGVRVPPSTILVEMLETKLWRSKKLKAKIKRCSIDFDYKPKGGK